MTSKKNNFVELFAKIGLKLAVNDASTFNTLTCDQRVLQSRLRSWLSVDKQIDENILKTFLENCTRYLDTESNFVMALLPTRNDTEMSSSHSSNQDSFLKLLLEIEELQLNLFDYLIQKLLYYSESDMTSETVTVMDGMSIYVPTYIINQFRYQPKIVDGALVCRKLMDLISSTSKIQIKKELIICIPDILNDHQHDSLVEELVEMLDDAEIITPTLETLSNLKFKDANTVQIVRKLQAKYATTSEEDLASLVKFILKAANSLNSKEIFMQLRGKLHFDEIANEKNRFNIFDIVREYFYISGQLIDIFLSSISGLCTRGVSGRSDEEADEEKEEEEEESDQNKNERSVIMKPLDFLIFSIIYTSTQHSKEIDKVFKQVLKEETWANLMRAIDSTIDLGRCTHSANLKSSQINYFKTVFYLLTQAAPL
jgi:hypothetical protein